MSASELADWWDTQRKESEKLLEEWVQENPQWWAVGLATATSTAMELGAGMVDALRFGEGMAQGGLKGVATDAMRLLVLVGPLAKAGGVLGRIAQTQMIRLAVETEGVTGPCTFTAVNNAASIVGGKARNFFLTARDAAKALGQTLGVADAQGLYDIAAWIEELVPFLVKQGVRLRNLGVPRSIAEVVQAAKTQNGVVIFAIEWTDVAGTIQRHSMIAVRTVRGVRFADYGGKFIGDLSQLARRGGIWQAVGGYRVAAEAGGEGAAYLMRGMHWIGALGRYAGTVLKGGMLGLEGIHAVETPDRGVELAIPVVPAAAIEANAHETEVIKQSFETFKARKAGKHVIRLPEIRITGRRKHGPPPVGYLTGVQYRLNALGYGAGPVDGKFGPKSERAVREFQQAYGLRVDAVPGPKTQQKLAEVCGF